jgi:L-fuculose-phosphate aldolase
MTSRRIKSELARYARETASAGLVIGNGGNLSARLRDVIYMKKRGASLIRANSADFVAVDIHTGKCLSNKARPTHEFRMHLLCYKQRKDIRAVLHAHPPIATALANKAMALKTNDYELFSTVKTDVPVIKSLPAGTEELAQAVAEEIKSHNALLLANHGIVTIGESLEEAYIRALAVERAAKSLVVYSIL